MVVLADGHLTGPDGAGGSPGCEGNGGLYLPQSVLFVHSPHAIGGSLGSKDHELGAHILICCSKDCACGVLSCHSPCHRRASRERPAASDHPSNADNVCQSACPCVTKLGKGERNVGSRAETFRHGSIGCESRPSKRGHSPVRYSLVQKSASQRTRTWISHGIEVM